MKYFYGAAVAALLSLGIYLVTSFELSPAAISRVPFTQVETAEDFGKVIFENLKAELASAPVLVLGATPNKIEDIELWNGFLQASEAGGLKYDVVIIEPMLPYVEIFTTGIRIPMRDDMPRLAEGIKKARADGLRVVIITANIYSSQSIKNNPANRLIAEYQLDLTSLSVGKFPVTREQEESFEPPCIVEESKDRSGAGSFGCTLRTLARKTYKNKFENNKYSGLMEQTAPKDYTIIFNRNPGSR